MPPGERKHRLRCRLERTSSARFFLGEVTVARCHLRSTSMAEGYNLLPDVPPLTFGSASACSASPYVGTPRPRAQHPRVFSTESVLAQGPNCIERLGYSSYPQRREDYITRDFSQSTRFSSRKAITEIERSSRCHAAAASSSSRPALVSREALRLGLLAAAREAPPQ